MGSWKCPDCGRYNLQSRCNCPCETSNFDPRFDQAQTVAGAKARYVDPDEDYTLSDFDQDVERVLSQGEYPDKPDRPLFEGQTVHS